MYAYDSTHNRISACEKIADGVWRETAWEYDSKGRRTLERDALGNETRWEYAPEGAHPARIITPKGEETVYEYDRMGRRMSVSNSYGTVEMAYNSRNFVTKRTDGEGHTSYKFYDNMGNLTTYYPPRQWEEKGEGYKYRYDYLERVADTISPLKTHRRIFRNFDGDITRTIHPVAYEAKGEEGEGIVYDYDMDRNLIRIHYPDGGVERRFYDADGCLTKQVLPEAYDADMDDGDGFCYAHDVCGRLTMVQDPEGNILHRYEYNGHGQVICELDGEGKETLYTYDSLGQKSREQVSIRREGDTAYYRVITFAYDSQGNKTEEAYGQEEVEKDGEPENWHKIYFSYDGNNHLSQVRDDFGAQMCYNYDCLGNVVLEERIVEEGIRSIIRYEYNKNGWMIRKTEEIQGNGEVDRAVTSYGYDVNGNLTSVKTPKGFEIRREYDADDRLTEERYIDKRNGIDCRVCYAYDAAGNVLTQTILGAEGEHMETSCRYDLNDRLIHRTAPGGAVTRYFYDWNGRLSKEIGPYGYEPEIDGGKGTSYAYDSRGNITRVTNALGELVQERSYNLQDLPIMEKDAFGNITEIAYGMDGQAQEVRRFGNGSWGSSPRGGAMAGQNTPEHCSTSDIDETQNSTITVGSAKNAAVSRSSQPNKRIIQQYEYNARGQIIGIIDGNREKVSYGLDGWGRITGVSFSDGVKEGYQYTPTGQVSGATDGNGNVVQYRYNSFGKVRERIDQLGEKEVYQYDEEGNLALHTDRDGRQVRRIYNIFGDPVYEKAIGADGEEPCLSTWQYDSLGRLIRAVSGGHSYEYEYDSLGRLKEKRSSGKRLISYTYDKMGQVTETRDPAGICTCYEYDALGRMARIHNGDGLEVRYGYDSLNRLEHISYGNGVETTYAYDMDGNLSRLETRSGEAVLLSFTYRYDGNGNRTAKTGSQGYATADFQGFSVSGSQNFATAGSSALCCKTLDIAYQYDIRGQLLEECRNGQTVRYVYDAARNRIKKTDAHEETVYHYNRKNQLTSEEGINGKRQFTYDRQGGITE